MRERRGTCCTECPTPTEFPGREGGGGHPRIWGKERGRRAGEGIDGINVSGPRGRGRGSNESNFDGNAFSLPPPCIKDIRISTHLL